MSCGETSGEDGRHRKKAKKTVSKVQRRNENTGTNDPGKRVEGEGRLADSAYYSKSPRENQLYGQSCHL